MKEHSRVALRSVTEEQLRHYSDVDTMPIHPNAVIHPEAQVDATVTVEAFAVIDAHVVVSAQCWIGPHVHITGHTRIGSNNRFHAGCVIGDAPQDLKYKGEPTQLVIGNENVFREHVTVHRSNTPSEATTIGSRNFLMANSHVGHNSQIGTQVVIANGALLGGHVSVGDRAFISGNCLIHQFTRVGALALMQGGAGISKDLPPFGIARGVNTMCGLNVIGMRRAGLSSGDRLELRGLYQTLFRSGMKLSDALAQVSNRYTNPHARAVIEFVAAAKRGICRDISRGGDDELDP